MIRTNLHNRNRLTDIENKLMVTKGREDHRGIKYKFGINRYTLLYIKNINNHVLVYSIKNYIQYLSITYNGKQSKKNILKHFALYLKHYKSATLQFLN